ncbi:MAG TPA: hypothetical protein VN026_12360 [Bacteroidia bacterium]|jgi:hypothetical protein|nr:hypothetical protein [Bacteroidia bacterium]
MSDIKKYHFTIWLFVLILFFGNATVTKSQTDMHDINFKAESEFQPTIKDAVKFTELPEIRDTVQRIHGAKYGITSNPLFPKYTVEPIKPAKMQNEPLTKLYHSLIKVGYGPIYNMPYGEAWVNSTRSRDMAYGVHYKHFSSMSHLRDVGYSGFSDNEAELFGKKFYKKHTLSGEFNYKRNVVHYYGFDTTLNKITDKDFTKQAFQLFEPTIKLQSHYTDSSKLNHTIKLSYYNLRDLYNAAENNVKLNTDLSTFIQKESFHLNILADYYNHKKPKDTINDFIFSANPYFEAHGKKWHADLGLKATVDLFGTETKFYFHPQLNAYYDIYESVIIPYAGLSGGLIKNSYRSLTNENPFINPQVNYANTNNKFNIFGGLRGNLSSTTSYDAKVSYGRYDNMHYYVIDYVGDQTLMDNKFKVIYANTNLLTVSGSVKYQYKEKIHFIAKGNYYSYQVLADSATKPYHKPNFDLTFSGLYNLKSKILIKADVFVIGSQWALTKTSESPNVVTAPLLLKGIVDCNLGAEYRYSKMLSFFVTFNNMANMRYLRWEKYPTQRFNMMLGLTFVPF